MKKAISLLLALVVVLGLGSVAFAADDYPGTYYNNRARLTTTVIPGNPTASPATTDTYAVGMGELFLVYNKNIVGVETPLQPDETYKMDIYYALTDVSGTSAQILASTSVRKLMKADIGDKGNVKVRTVKGSSAVQSAKIKTVGSGAAQTYRLDVETRPNYGTDTKDLEYTLNVVDASTNNTFVESNHTFTIGYNTISDSDTEVGEGGTITISNEAPVITKDQFADIAKSANYKNVTFESDDGNWTFTGKVAGMKSSNFTFNYDPDTDLLNKFPDQEFKFVNFPAGVNFPTTGEMRIDVSDVSDDFKTMYAYLYRDGKLTAINATYDSGADELTFRTNYLGRFIITNQAITDTSMLPEEPEEEPDIDIPEPPEIPENPNTGVDNSMSVMAALALLSLASAAAVGRKRK